jgi:hypothetical protein
MSGDDERLRAEYTQETRQLPPGVAECSPGDELNHACREGMREAAFERWKAAAELAQRHWNIKEDE